jgi:hypothetical protein
MLGKYHHYSSATAFIYRTKPFEDIFCPAPIAKVTID